MDVPSGAFPALEGASQNAKSVGLLSVNQMHQPLCCRRAEAAEYYDCNVYYQIGKNTLDDLVVRDSCSGNAKEQVNAERRGNNAHHHAQAERNTHVYRINTHCNANRGKDWRHNRNNRKRLHKATFN